MSFFRSPKIDEDGQLQIRDEWLLTGVGGPDAPDRVEPPTGAWLFRVTPAQATKQLIQDVDALDADGSLNRGQAQSLRTTLARALESIADEQPDKAIQALTVFTRQVAGSVLARRLSFDEGQALIAAAQNAIVGLQAG